MTFDELKVLINEMSKAQRTTEVCVFEEGTRRYIWPAHLRGEDTLRPYLEGVAAEGDPGVEFFEPPVARGTRDVDSVKPHPNAIDSPDAPKGSVRPHPTGLDRSVAKRPTISKAKPVTKKKRRKSK